MPYRLNRAFLRLAGPDATSFLNNLVTQDVTRLSQERVLYASLLTPQGKVIADMFLWGGQEEIFIELDPSRAEDVLRRLSMYKLRANVAIENVSSSLSALWDAKGFARAAADPRFPDGALGWRAIGAAFDLEDGSGHLDARRIALGTPDLARDAALEEVFALEALLEELHGVDFQKGCFVGQENVSRMKRRATTRKKFCPVVFEGEPPPYGAAVRAGEAEFGSIRTGLAGRAIALLRLDRARDAIAKGEELRAGDTPIRLDPPDWLILPARDD